MVMVAFAVTQFRHSRAVATIVDISRTRSEEFLEEPDAACLIIWALAMLKFRQHRCAACPCIFQCMVYTGMWLAPAGACLPNKSAWVPGWLEQFWHGQVDSATGCPDVRCILNAAHKHLIISALLHRCASTTAGGVVQHVCGAPAAGLAAQLASHLAPLSWQPHLGHWQAQPTAGFEAVQAAGLRSCREDRKDARQEPREHVPGPGKAAGLALWQERLAAAAPQGDAAVRGAVRRRQHQHGGCALWHRLRPGLLLRLCAPASAHRCVASTGCWLPLHAPACACAGVHLRQSGIFFRDDNAAACS